MKTLYISPDQILTNEPVAGTVGFFDGVHRGHRFLTDQLRSIAAKQQLATAVITFPMHPGSVLFPEFHPELLTRFEEKLLQLASTGVDYCYVIRFTKDLSRLTAREFIRRVLCKQLNVQTLLVGYDHRFGKDRTEGVDAYIQYGKETGMEVREAKPLLVDGLHVSSTRIRQSLALGEVEEAARLLSYAYQVEGKVVEGNRIGRTIGFPTANIALNDQQKAIPAAGIYSVWTTVNGQRHKGMLYIGSRPTLKGSDEWRIEVNLLDFAGDLYGQEIKVEFVKRLRNDRQFDSLEEMRKQLEEDRRVALNSF